MTDFSSQLDTGVWPALKNEILDIRRDDDRTMEINTGSF